MEEKLDFFVLQSVKGERNPHIPELLLQKIQNEEAEKE